MNITISDDKMIHVWLSAFCGEFTQRYHFFFMGLVSMGICGSWGKPEMNLFVLLLFLFLFLNNYVKYFLNDRAY